jgi:hypothetical protein
MTRLRATALLTILLATAPASAQEERRVFEPELPAALRGFAGELEGEVTRRMDAAFLLRVQRVVRSWDHSEAERPEEAVGRLVRVDLRWEEHEGRWRPAPRQVAWLQRHVEEGTRVCVDLANDEGHRLHLMELNADQRAQLEGRDDREHDRERDRDRDRDRDAEWEEIPQPPLPDGFHGFSGQVRGIVARANSGRLLLVVSAITRRWRGDRSREPEQVVWRAVRVQARTDLHGQWVATLRPGQDVTVELRHHEGRLEILELSEDQRQAARR